MSIATIQPKTYRIMGFDGGTIQIIRHAEIERDIDSIEIANEKRLAEATSKMNKWLENYFGIAIKLQTVECDSMGRLPTPAAAVVVVGIDKPISLRCRWANTYKGMRPPKCGPCHACLTKWQAMQRQGPQPKRSHKKKVTANVPAG